MEKLINIKELRKVAIYTIENKLKYIEGSAHYTMAYHDLYAIVNMALEMNIITIEEYVSYLNQADSLFEERE